MARTYNVYVIRLGEGVLRESKFRRRNPGYRPGRPCVYVGSSARTPDQRFDQHKQSYRGNRYARRYGEALMPEVFERYNPVPTRRDAEDLEAYLAERLRAEGWGVWQG